MVMSLNEKKTAATGGRSDAGISRRPFTSADGEWNARILKAPEIGPIWMLFREFSWSGSAKI
jgi:hypothetical protein